MSAVHVALCAALDRLQVVRGAPRFAEELDSTVAGGDVTATPAIEGEVVVVSVLPSAGAVRVRLHAGGSAQTPTAANSLLALPGSALYVVASQGDHVTILDA